MLDFLVIPYALLCTIIIFLSSKRTGSLFNAMSLYSLLWATMLLFYQLKIIAYYTLSSKTWAIVFLTTIIVASGYFIGLKLYFGISDSVKSVDDSKEALHGIIAFLTIFSLMAIIPNTIRLVQRYGFNLFSATSRIYYDKLYHVGPQQIPYVGYAAQAAATFASIYIVKYGFKGWFILPIFCSVLNTLPSGSRGNIILTVFMIMMPIIILNKNRHEISRTTKRRLLITIALLIIVFIVLTINRSQGIKPKAAGSYFLSIYQHPAVYKLYQYFSSPVGVLNAYLENPEFSFGANSFGTLYNFLNKLGAHFEYHRYQQFYNIPIRANAGTWIRELIMDFSMLGMFAVTFLFGVLVGVFEKKASINCRNVDVYIAAILDTILVMSFFVWYLREGCIIVLLLMSPIAKLKEKFRITVA